MSTYEEDIVACPFLYGDEVHGNSVNQLERACAGDKAMNKETQEIKSEEFIKAPAKESVNRRCKANVRHALPMKIGRRGRPLVRGKERHTY